MKSRRKSLVAQLTVATIVRKVLQAGILLCMLAILGLMGGLENGYATIPETMVRVLIAGVCTAVVVKAESFMKRKSVILQNRIKRADQRAWAAYLADLYDDPQKLTRMYLGLFGEDYVAVSQTGRSVAKVKVNGDVDPIEEYCHANGIPHIRRANMEGVWTYDGFSWVLLRAKEDFGMVRILAYDPMNAQEA